MNGPADCPCGEYGCQGAEYPENFPTNPKGQPDFSDIPRDAWEDGAITVQPENFSEKPCSWQPEHYLMESCGECGFKQPVGDEDFPEDGIVKDGFGSYWQKCGPACDVQVVRPGKVQCSCDDGEMKCMCEECDRQLTYEEEQEFEVKASKVYDQALGVLISKHQDYGPKNISDSPGGALNGLRVRMHDKLARINHLVDSGVEPANESLRDSFLDLHNYAAIGILVLDGDWPDA